jgi:signal transduction histidine kinase
MLDLWKLLIVDDCAADRKVYRRLLSRDPQQSYHVLEAESAEDALSIYKKQKCDVILLDFCLPDMSGLEFLDQLKLQIIGTPMPVIMLTGHGDEGIAAQAMRMGIQDYLVKRHLQADVLQLAVRNVIQRSHLQTQLAKTRDRQRLIATTALRIRQSLDLAQILDTAVTEVHQLLENQVLRQGVTNLRVMIHQFSPNNHINIESCFPQGIESGMENLCIQDECKKAIARTYQAGESLDSPQIVDILNAPHNLVVPIILPENGKPTPTLWGLLIAHQSLQIRQWQRDEIEMLHELSVQLAIAIQQAEFLKKTQSALEKEQKLNAFKSKIITTVSHEYRTPLTSILTAASTIKQHYHNLSEERKNRFLDIIEIKARHMSKLVDDMLLVNEIELSKTKFQPLPLDLLNFFSDLLEEQRLTLDEHHNLSFKVAGNNKGFWGDRCLLRQIFFNLISNAIKYSPDGGEIEFYLKGSKSKITFSVTDKGIGIPEKEQENIFQSFSRGSNVDNIPGTGLGLTIVKACVDIHGGELFLESAVDRGTQITVTLPKRLQIDLG